MRWPPEQRLAGIGPAERARERSMLLGAVLDCAIVVPMMAAGVWANSLTLIGESLRAVLLIALELYLLALLRRIHRGRMAEYEYGAAKLEQFGNLLVGAAMLLGASWVLGTAALRLAAPPGQPALGMAAAALVAAVNVGINGVVFHAIWRAGRDGTSIILAGQIRSRLAKLIASGLAAGAIAVNALAGEGATGRAADTAGSLLVAVTMIALGVGMWREALPHLVDRRLDEARQVAINRVLARHFAAYEELGTVRTRLVGRGAAVELTLGFAPGRPIGEIQRVVDTVAADLRALVPGAQVTVTPVAAGATAT